MPTSRCALKPVRHGLPTFFRDVLEFPGIDAGDGLLIFTSGPSELAVHPSSWQYEGQTGSTDQQFDVSLRCDDLDKTITELSEGR